MKSQGPSPAVGSSPSPLLLPPSSAVCHIAIGDKSAHCAGNEAALHVRCHVCWYLQYHLNAGPPLQFMELPPSPGNLQHSAQHGYLFCVSGSLLCGQGQR